MLSRIWSNPYLVGVIIALGLFLGLLASLRWAPWIWDARNQWWMQLAFCATALFAATIAKYWKFHERPRFWASLVILVAIHAIAVLLLIDSVRALRLATYMIILPADILLSFVFVEWFMDKRRRETHARGES